MARVTLVTLHHDILQLRTDYRASAQVSSMEDILQLEQLTRAVKLLRDDMILSEIHAGVDYETIGVKHGVGASRIGQIKAASTRLPKGPLIKPVAAPRRHYPSRGYSRR